MPDILAPTLHELTTLAQAANPMQVDGPFIARVVSRMLHILAAIMLGGGLFYLRAVLSPAGAESCYAGRRSVWARWVGIASFLLIATGLFNFFVILSQYRDAGQKLPSSYHMLFGFKVLLALLVMFIASILAGKTAAAERFRGNLARWLNVGWTAVIAIVVLGALLRAHHTVGPPPAAGGAAQPAEASDG